MTNDGQNALVYDAVNRVTSASGSLGSGTYAYQGSGHRVVKTSGSTTTVYVYSGKRPIAEYTNGALTKEYIYLGNRLIATYDSGTLYYHHPDHLSERVTTDGSGNKVGEQAHYPYGEDWYLTSTTTKWRLTTYERDPESANDYAVHRYNANRLGRFLSTDPVLHVGGNPQMFNRYTYVHGTPSIGATSAD
jgi:RHS repeat-associated protein